MKKTVIAAALASTVFSGAAMAWTANGTGGNIELGGNIQVTPYTTPWEVVVGAPATTLDANITKGTKVVAIPVTKAIPVLGIRTVSKTPFNGAVGISPQIDFKGAVDIDKNVWGRAPLILDVLDTSSNKIGTLSASILTAAVYSNTNTKSGAASYGGIMTYNKGSAFFGGLGNSLSALNFTDAVNALNRVSGEFLSNFTQQGGNEVGNSMHFSNPDEVFSSAYGAGIETGNNIKLTLTNPAANDVIKWKASLPVTVSYQ